MTSSVGENKSSGRVTDWSALPEHQSPKPFGPTREAPNDESDIHKKKKFSCQKICAIIVFWTELLFKKFLAP